jgi:hypothetical protein
MCVLKIITELWSKLVKDLRTCAHVMLYDCVACTNIDLVVFVGRFKTSLKIKAHNIILCKNETHESTSFTRKRQLIEIIDRKCKIEKRPIWLIKN